MSTRKETFYQRSRLCVPFLAAVFPSAALVSCGESAAPAPNQVESATQTTYLDLYRRCERLQPFGWENTANGSRPGVPDRDLVICRIVEWNTCRYRQGSSPKIAWAVATYKGDSELQQDFINDPTWWNPSWGERWVYDPPGLAPRQNCRRAYTRWTEEQDLPQQPVFGTYCRQMRLFSASYDDCGRQAHSFHFLVAR